MALTHDDRSQIAPLGCDVAYVEDRAVFSLSGELDLASAPALRREVNAALALPIVGLTLDLRALEFLDSSGLHCLLAARNDAADRGIRFELVRVPRHALRVIAVTGLNQILGVPLD